MSNRLVSLASAAIFAAGTLVFANAANADGVKVGVLTCHESSGWGFVFGSSKDLRCHFSPISGHGEHYTGTVSKFGVDIGYTSGGVIIWDVLAPNSGIERGALTGEYVGAQASAAVGAGAGANVLVGGLHRSFTLQPVSIEGETGLNVAAGIGAISLKFAGADHR
ncbi:MAG: DUF992 domain-containing protein [Rhizomicrobium sp.]